MKYLADTFNLIFRYNEDELFINNNDFHSYVDSIYRSELEINDITESYMFVSCLDIALNRAINDKLTTQFYVNYTGWF